MSSILNSEESLVIEIQRIRANIEKKEQEIVTLYDQVHEMRVELKNLELAYSLSKRDKINFKGYDC